MAYRKKEGSGRPEVCRECGRRFEAFRRDAKFCAPECTSAFNVRRASRGSALYDLMMINRHERGVAKAMKVWFLVTRLLMYWREEDQRTRDGRPSWTNAEDAVDRVAWARATVVHRGK